MKYIKLFEHTYSIYDLITMPMWKATELLIEECKKDNPDMDLVRDLFEYAVLDVNWQTKNGFTALYWASMNGRTEIVKMLLERPEIDVNLQDEEWGHTALIIASYEGHTEIVKLLLERPEIDVNLENEHGETALIIASEGGHTEVVKLLLERPEIDVNQKAGGWTALMKASRRGYTEIADLIKAHPNFNPEA